MKMKIWIWNGKCLCWQIWAQFVLGKIPCETLKATCFTFFVSFLKRNIGDLNKSFYLLTFNLVYVQEQLLKYERDLICDLS